MRAAKNFRRGPVCGVAAALTLAGGGMSSAVAQEVATASEPIQEVVVTGSRLRRDDLSAPSPTVLVSNQDIQLSGRGTLEGLLNELPQLRPDTGATTANIGQAGLHTADLRGLRPERTLVLVNGKRFTPANESGLVDLSRIPDALVKRIEVTTGGASAVYGSDAIAGAVNFIMRDAGDIDGLEVRYDYGQTFESDGENHKLDLIWGTKFADDRGSMVVNVGTYEQSPVLFDNRDFSRINMDIRNGALVPAGTSNNPGSAFFLTPTQINSLVGVNLSDFTTDRDFSVGGSGSCTQVQGIRFGRNGVPLPYCDPEDRYNYNKGNYLLRPYKRYNISALADFKVNDKIDAYTELFYTNNRNTWNLNVASFQPQTSGRNSLFLPNYASNTALYQATRDFLSANAGIFDPDGDGNAEIFAAGRNLTEAGFRYFNYDNSSYSITGGLRGDLPFSDWQFDTYYQLQRATEAQNQQNTVSNLRLSLGLDVVVDPVTGQARCRNQFQGCVPVNLLGIDAASPEAVAFLTPDKGDQEFFSRNVFQASMNGTLFSLPAGAVSAALGFEWREQGYEFKPGGLNEAGPLGGQQPSIDADNSVWELFTEVRIPLLKDIPGIDSLAVELAYRYSDYNTSGGVETYKAGLEWGPVDWLRFRGAFNRAVRAPNLRELYAPQTRGFEGGEDPCDSQQNPSQAVKDFCVLTGVPADVIDTFVPSVDLTGRRGGNPNLVPEESDTMTLGFVMSPPFIRNFNLTLDYYNIKVNDAINTVTAEQQLATCYQLLDLNDQSCRSITRLPNGLVFEVLALASNISTFEVNGLDLQFDWGFELPAAFSFGGNGAMLHFRGLAGWMFERKSQQIDIAPVVDCAGRMGTGCSGFGNRPIPDFTSKIDLRYVTGGFGAGLSMRTIGSFGFVPGDNRGAVFNNKVASENYFDFDASYEVSDALAVHAIVKNLADEQPTVLGQGIAGDAGVDVGLYDVLGRRFVVGFNYSFH
jgi:outer membrane receptor protein involved in Fe transport